MIIPEWYNNPVLDETQPFKTYIRSTPSFRGVVISPTGNYDSEGEYSPRRYSVIRIWPGNHFELIIGSTFYVKDGFDSEDIDEPLEKFLAGAFTTLYRIPTDRTVEMQDISEWGGSSQQLKAMFP